MSRLDIMVLRDEIRRNRKNEELISDFKHRLYIAPVLIYDFVVFIFVDKSDNKVR